MSTKEECVFVTEDEFDRLLEWCDNVPNRCGDDGWMPTVQELESTVIIKYRALAGQRRKSTVKEKEFCLINRQKEILFFLMWITETNNGQLPKETNSFIKDFLTSRLVLVT